MSAEATPTTTSPPSTLERLLRTPLLTKIVLLDAAINVVVLALMRVLPSDYTVEVMGLSLVGVLFVNAALVAWALRPLGLLEQTARRVSDGAFDARVAMPPWTEANLARIGRTFDALLDRVASERLRVRRLASQVVATGDQERARIARELHDGTAQSLSALDMLLASALADGDDGPSRGRLVQMRDIVADALVEVRDLAQTVHPRVLDDLGLPAALEFLVRRARSHTPATIEVVSTTKGELPVEVASVLYRVAQEALHNAVKHAQAARIEVVLRVEDGAATLQVVDDGVGFDPDAVDTTRRGMGLFVMHERVSLVDGRFLVRAPPGGGTEVRAIVPVDTEGA